MDHTRDGRELDDAAALQAYRDVLDGTTARKRAVRMVEEDFEDRLDWALQAWKDGQPIGRDDEEILRERGHIR